LHACGVPPVLFITLKIHSFKTCLAHVLKE
jgi:hypothetical protein